MKSWAVAGSTVSGGSAWSRRACGPEGGELPIRDRRHPGCSGPRRRIPPGAGRPGQTATRPAGRVVASARAVTVVMPLSSKWPRTAATTARSSPANAARASSMASVVAPQLAIFVLERDGPTGRGQLGEQAVPVRRGAAEPGPTRAGRAARPGSRASGWISACTRSMAAGSREPMVDRSTLVHAADGPRWSAGSGTPRRRERHMAGRVMISWASTDGSVVSRQWTPTSPVSIRSTRASTPSMSRASCRVSSMVWRTRRWSGISMRTDHVVLAGRSLREDGGQ